MSKALEELGTAFADAEVKNVAIVDDGYDAPGLRDVDEEHWLAFAVAIDEAEELGAFAEVVNEIGELGTLDDLREPSLHRLWDAYKELCEPAVAEDALPVERACHRLFRSFHGRKSAKLRQLASVERMLEAATGSMPEQLPSTTRAEELVDFDLVFLDFFLGDEDVLGDKLRDSLVEAEKRASNLAKAVSEMLSHSNTPLFVIISGQAQPESVPQFRDNAELLASKFRFLSKKSFDEDKTQVYYVLRQLAAQRTSSNSIEKLLKDWRESAGAALEEMLGSVRRLDVTEYGYMQHYRLESNRTSLRSYLTWLYGAYLSALVEERVAFASLDSIEALKREEVPPANLPPMSEVPKIYSKITTTKVQSENNGTAVPIWTGDLFVREGMVDKGGREEGEENGNGAPVAEGESVNGGGPREAGDGSDREEQEEEGRIPDILAAITPVCDLVPGREKAKSIVLLGGELREFGKARRVSNHLLVLEGNGDDGRSSERQFQVDWDKKWPYAFPRKAFDGRTIKGTDYRRVGRLRELYAVEVAQFFSGDVARVGVPVAPPFTHALHVRAVTKQEGNPVVILDAPVEEPFAWELYPDRTKESRVAVFAEEFLWRLREELERKIADRRHACWRLLDDPAKLAALTTPFEVKMGKGNNITRLPEFSNRLSIRRVETLPEDVSIRDDHEVIVLWAAGPMVARG